MPTNKPLRKAHSEILLRDLDCAVLNFGLDRLDREGVGYDTVRGIFPEGDFAFPGSCIQVKTHVQVAVRNLDSIVGYFRPFY